MTVSLSVVLGPDISSMVHAVGGRETASPRSLPASNSLSIVGLLRSFRRCMLIAWDRTRSFSDNGDRAPSCSTSITEECE